MAEDRPDSCTRDKKRLKSPFRRAWASSIARRFSAIKMESTQNGSVTRGSPDLGQVGEKFLLGNLTQNFLAKKAADCPQFIRDGSVLGGQIRVVRTGVQNAKAVAAAVRSREICSTVGCAVSAKSMATTPPTEEAVWSISPQGLPKKTFSAYCPIWASSTGVHLPPKKSSLSMVPISTSKAAGGGESAAARDRGGDTGVQPGTLQWAA